ncbi:hypothetical protein AGLY_016876 [Aphis glycines]|uniref:Uncharacterized protein n=1 Tax=Aphis glycines TaxID=307491 RepID=A0A6G0SWH7_APHGL|nr:hypothetical protein AGLY_016876 [Aphis glycines]
MFTFNGYKHQGHSICSRKPPSNFVIGAFFRLVMLILFKYRFGRIPVLCKICRFRSFFFSFMSIVMKTVGKCSLLTVISIKDIRFAVENHPKKSYLNIDLVGFRFYVRFAVFGHFFFVYLNYLENCWEMFIFNGYKHQGHSICSRKPPSKFVIGVFFRLRFGRIPVLCKIFRFRSFFFLFISIIMKTVGKCSLLTVISIKDIRFSVENHPQSLFSVFGHFFFVYLNYFENCWEMFTFNGYKHQGHSICSRKPPSQFVIGAFFRLVMLYKETKKKNFRNL